MTAPGVWIEHARCGGLPVGMFFSSAGSRKVTEKAKLVCQACPVIAQCAEYGKAERFGIWGGLTPRERNPKFRHSGDWVDATGSRRRLRALAALGYGPGHLEMELIRFGAEDLTRHGLIWIRQQAIRTESGKAEVIERLYRHLIHRGQNPATRSITARKHAAREQWPTPGDWAGIDMDDPLAQPRPRDQLAA